VLKPSLNAVSPLNGYSKTFASIKLSEVTELAIVSITFSLNETSSFKEAFSKYYGNSLPEYGSSTLSKDSTFRFMSMQPGMIFAIYEYVGLEPISVLTSQLGATAFFSDQSDSSFILRLSGKNLHKILERVCAPDLSNKPFPPNSVARTTVDHLNAIILHEKNNNFLFISPRSSARSFLNALETSIENTL
tara:strand:+ start:255 stop:824 length:570 start_codon:yes stop_codon:yes gene_type:complete